MCDVHLECASPVLSVAGQNVKDSQRVPAGDDGVGPRLQEGWLCRGGAIREGRTGGWVLPLTSGQLLACLRPRGGFVQSLEPDLSIAGQKGTLLRVEGLGMASLGEKPQERRAEEPAWVAQRGLVGMGLFCLPGFRNHLPQRGVGCATCSHKDGTRV